ncbi:MAG: helix-turn-helix domain-containing protein [Candidatus Dormibacteraceae bacterium]
MESDRSPWLSLGEASRLLGITPATLRRWADSGEVPTFVTPGGHRRFPRTVIEGLMPRLRRRRPALGGSGGATTDRIAQAYRRARPIERPVPPPWLRSLSDADRAEFRARGRAFLTIVIELLDEAGREARASRVVEARLAADEYGRLASRLGASLTETVEAFLRFRGSFVGELAGVARRRRLDTREATALLVEAESLMDDLLLVLMQGHGR